MPTPARTRTSRRTARLAPLAAGVLLVAALAGCGSDDDSGAEGPGGLGGSAGVGEDVVVLDQAQVDRAVLSPDNLGLGFEPEPDDGADDEDDEDSAGLGCLAAVDEDLDQAEAKAEASYEATNELGTPSVSSGVSSFATTDDVTERFDRLRAALEDCDRIDVTEDDGPSFALEVDSDDATVSDEVDEQLNISAVGSATAEGFELPVTIRLSAARIDNHVVFLSRFDLGETTGELTPYTEAAVGRLLAVLAGDEPDEEPVVADTGAGGSGDAA
ncbi:sensor domain-containing protein [Nocardioides abyssi]|uniref:Sensor domain-containing protein n=1 Tax=Nocardioides abyssi TaxID=3058370 RepID=A0ABT8ESD6_9ACTN|nr:sensor domain-containing protein [Nocardioides abyssi]MDN4161045.1 sensor domain-containing protein [Nocardioides abyssi]